MYCIVFATASDKKEAKRISQQLLEAKLIACANIIDEVKSFFWWQGKIDKADEVMLVLKTKQALVSQTVKLIKEIHSYDVPEVIAIPIVDGNEDYLQWIDESVKE